jgi:predicted transcriptional regulator
MVICKERITSADNVARRILDYLDGQNCADPVSYSTDRRICEKLELEIRRVRYSLHVLWRSKLIERATLRGGERIYRLTR